MGNKRANKDNDSIKFLPGNAKAQIKDESFYPGNRINWKCYGQRHGLCENPDYIGCPYG
ncbi:MAG: hypothetical protein M0R33_13840 [Methylomonas sp.]|jgi:hypothetical protein|nr:hypothetical protein [Methylomonas sp.]